MVELKQIDKDNFEQIINLKLSKNQENYVSSNVHSLAQTWIYKKTSYPFAIHEDDIVVGFVMLGFYEQKNQYTLWKFMIDEKYQNKGYGKKALNLAISWLKVNFNVKEVYTGVYKGNLIAENLYYSFGFRKTGVCEENQIEMKLILQ